MIICIDRVGDDECGLSHILQAAPLHFALRLFIRLSPLCPDKEARTVMDSFISQLDYPLFVVTAAAGAERSGCLVGFASQCSINPVRFTVWLSKANQTFRTARAAGQLAVHLLRPDQHRLAELFGGRSGDDGVDKFAGVPWTPGPGGVPVLDGCPAWFVGRIERQCDDGDHVAFLLAPVEHGTNGPPTNGVFRLSDAGDIAPAHPAD